VGGPLVRATIEPAGASSQGATAPGVIFYFLGGERGEVAVTVIVLVSTLDI
jgi:hypothetical protein